MGKDVFVRRTRATLRAFGFRRRTLGWLVVAENGFLLVTGIVVGAVAGLVAVAPHLSGHLPWAALGGTLGLVLVFGLAAGAVVFVKILAIGCVLGAVSGYLFGIVLRRHWLPRHRLPHRAARPGFLLIWPTG